MNEPGVFERLTHALAGWHDCEQRVRELEAEVARLQLVVALLPFARRLPAVRVPRRQTPRKAPLRPKQVGHL
jgi:hypothetical protein